MNERHAAWRRHTSIAITFGMLSVTPALAHAASLPTAAYPERPVRAIVPFPPGQGADILMRFLAERELGWRGRAAWRCCDGCMRYATVYA